VLARLGLAHKLRVTPAIAIEQARVDMQFKRTQEQLARKAAYDDRHHALAPLREMITREYEAFTATLAEWTAAREAWMSTTRERVAETRERFAEQFASVDLKAFAREIEERLRAQRRRLELLTLQIA
jgi:stearoyl-CoA desaturase (delta-9 desaturase)